MTLSRRDLLRAAGVTAGALAAGGCTEAVDPYALVKPSAPGADGWPKGEEKWVSSVCGQCQAGCGIRVRVVEGRAVAIRGHDRHPLNQGGLGPKGQAGIELLYHPDRVRGPMKREGPRGSGRWQSIGWDQAVEEISASMGKMRASGSPHGLVVLDGEPEGMTHQLWDRFLTAFGSPNHVCHFSTTDGAKRLAMEYMHGVHDLPAYDWDGVRYVIGFGPGLFESWCQSIHFMRVASRLRRDTPGLRAKFVQVSSRFSTTSAKADEWMSIRPGSHGALALGLAHILVRDGHYDADFVRQHTFGFENWTDSNGKAHPGFREMVLGGYGPDKVAEHTGLSRRTIERLARELIANQPAVALADDMAAARTEGLGTAMAIHALNALLGNLERPGGLLVQRRAPLAPWPEVRPDAVASTGTAQPRIDGAGTDQCPLGRTVIQNVPEAILSGKPNEVGVLVLYRSNPVFSKPQGQRWIEALRRVPLVVSCSPLRDESTLWADYLLPDHTYLERWELVEPAAGLGYPVVGLRQPVVKPRHDTLATGDLVIRLAQALGSPVGDAFPWDDYRSAVVERMRGLLDAEGAPASLSGLNKQLKRDSAWWDDRYPFEQWDSAFQTPSGKFEFYSQTIASRLPVSMAARADSLCLPHWSPPRLSAGEDKYPFVLVPYRGIAYAEGGVRHLPLLRELPLSGTRFGWKERIELHPEDAGRLGVGSGDPVWVESPASRWKLFTVLNEGVSPGTAALALGLGSWPPDPSQPPPGGGWDLLDGHEDRLAGLLSLQETRVRISRVSS